MKLRCTNKNCMDRPLLYGTHYLSCLTKTAFWDCVNGGEDFVVEVDTKTGIAYTREFGLELQEDEFIR